ncbi:hypothetical protein FACS1894139_03160 [Planctomycetales bacterium]|nr:hypothetical protein FACS1894107_08400 [Planctomycetales bacterium]GHT03273.1 hypothetical protein FACS1894139_03160 [Planctomycetales bacterium]
MSLFDLNVSDDEWERVNAEVDAQLAMLGPIKSELIRNDGPIVANMEDDAGEVLKPGLTEIPDLAVFVLSYGDMEVGDLSSANDEESAEKVLSVGA